MLDRIEAELAGQPAFGDAQGIFDRLRAIVLLFLEGAAKGGRPLIQALHQELRDGPHRQAATVLADPVVRAGWRGMFRRNDESPVEDFDELFAATLRHLRKGASSLPTAAGCPLHARPRSVPHDIALYDPALSQPVFKRRLEADFDKYIGGWHPVLLQRPSPALVKAVERGCELLAALLPELAASALAHLRLIGFLSSKGSRQAANITNITSIRISSTTFLHRASLRTPWVAAEVLLHEAVHCKLGT